MREPDDELMHRVQGRDQAAFGRLLARHLSSIHRYLMRLTDSRADADELSQETFLRLWQRAGRYRPGTVKLTTWLHRIAHNLAVDELRRRHTRPGASPGPSGESDDGSTVADTAADRVTDPEALALSREAGQRLHAAIGALPANQRAALLLCQVQGFSNREAAAILGVSVRSLESLVARARRSLRHTVIDDVLPERRENEP